ncbi:MULTISPECIES: pyridoxamine 5'-phosphate oxidase family protein [Flavobacterium]|jgi:general stress protein 26|uniref:pyridoxamine 5'-phosphate oxidase family protein n=1 Tax=Flavobacterium TaxID=237 RepID=UPI002481EE32|nr:MULTISPECIES: pyridoxamine 5'-phosphate oxidase family protein [Flavobacterium]
MHENLINAEAIKKIKSLAGDIKIAIFCTQLAQIPIQSRPMAVQDIDDEGNLWFISSTDSDKNHEIQQDNQVQLFFSNISSSQYLSVYGHATIFRDQQKIDELWSPIAKAWFEEGKKDPKVSVIKVTPADSYYWDTKNSKIITLLKIASAAVFGTDSDVGVKGNLKV